MMTKYEVRNYVLFSMHCIRKMPRTCQTQEWFTIQFFFSVHGWISWKHVQVSLHHNVMIWTCSLRFCEIHAHVKICHMTTDAAIWIIHLWGWSCSVHKLVDCWKISVNIYWQKCSWYYMGSMFDWDHICFNDFPSECFVIILFCLYWLFKQKYMA